MSIKKKKLIRDALGSPIPQYYNEEQGIFVPATNGTGDASSVDFTKIKLIRDALDGVIPQYFDVLQKKFVPSTNEGGGGGEQGPPGKDGSQWLFGADIPDDGGGIDGDYYLQSDGNVWNKQNNVWVFTGINLKGPQGDETDITNLEQAITDLDNEVTAHLDNDNTDAHEISNIRGLQAALNNKSDRRATIGGNVDPNIALESFITTYHPNAGGGSWFITTCYDGTSIGPETSRTQIASSYGGPPSIKTRHFLSGQWSPWSNEPQWINGTLLNGWNGTIKYYKNDLGIVNINANAYGGTVTVHSAISNLPIGYRPTQTCVVDIISDTGNIIVGALYIQPNGNVVIGNTISSGIFYIISCLFSAV